jgi:hypothetical protein
MPATPRPETVAPSGQPVQSTGSDIQGQPDAGSGASLTTPATPPSPGALSLAPGALGNAAMPPVLLASQPASPSPGAPQPGSPQPGAPQPGSPQPGAPQPGAPSPGSPPPGSPPSPGSGSPPSPSPSQPGSPSQPPGGTGSPVVDAGASDGSLPLPPVPDAGLPRDSGMEPILRRD